MINRIIKKHEAAKAALAEFERKKAESTAIYAARGESPPTTILTALEKISIELKRKNEEIKKKKSETKELYHCYTIHIETNQGRTTGYHVLSRSTK
jgi:hypothetical protein